MKSRRGQLLAAVAVALVMVLTAVTYLGWQDGADPELASCPQRLSGVDMGSATTKLVTALNSLSFVGDFWAQCSQLEFWSPTLGLKWQRVEVGGRPLGRTQHVYRLDALSLERLREARQEPTLYWTRLCYN